MGLKAKKNYSFRLQEGVISNIQVIAKKQNRTVTNLVETILIEYNERTLEEIRKGNGIPKI